MESEYYIFMLMPALKKFDFIYEECIKKPLVKQGYMVKRDKEITGSTPIFEDIQHNIRTADIIIADLTGQNPNVFLELGIVFDKRKYVILIAQEGELLPFDLSQRRTIFYNTDENGLKKLTRDILTYVKSYKKAQYINDIITNFSETNSYTESIEIWFDLKNFEPDLNKEQIYTIVEATIQNKQINESYVLRPQLQSFFKRHKGVLLKEMIVKLKDLGYKI